MGELTIPVLPRRLSLIFLWTELSRRYPIPIVNTVLKKFLFLGGGGVHTLICLHWKITRKQIFLLIYFLYLCWLVDNVMTNWIFFGKIIDECSLTLIFYRHWRVFFLSDDQQISNEGLLCWSKSKIEVYVIFWLPQKLWQKITRNHWFEICDKTNDTCNFDIKHN